MKLISFSIFKKYSKNHDKNATCSYLPEISFAPQRDNGPLGVKNNTESNLSKPLLQPS